MTGDALPPPLDLSGLAPAMPVLSETLMVVAIALPLALAFGALVPAVRRVLPHLLVFVPLPALIAALAVPRGLSVLVAPDPFRFTLALDAPGALLLGGAALLWMTASAYAMAYLRKDPARPAFIVWWLLTMAGSFAVFLVADVASFYLAYALVSFSAYGLAAHDDTVEARRAGALYLALTVLGEALLIAAFVMLASGPADANPQIRDAVALLPASPWKTPILLLILLGFTLKMGLFPLHVWMPLAHSVAPVPGSAALSGIVVKAGVIGLLRFLPEGVPLPGWGALLCGAGLFTAYYGVAVGLTQRHPKRALAYSTVSQMGVVAAVIGAGIMNGTAGTFTIAAFYAANHMLLKGAMFLMVGVAMAASPRRALAAAAVAALLGLSLAGLPLSGGAMAKYAIKLIVPDGGAGVLLTLSAAGSTLLMARYALLVARSGTENQKTEGKEMQGRPPRGLVLPALALAVLALFAPFALFAEVTGVPVSAAFTAAALVKGFWPVGLGLGVAALLAWKGPRVPEVPAGDILHAAGFLSATGRTIMEGTVAADAVLRRWPVAALALLGVAVSLAATLTFAAMP
ncbi:complex I subunit 5 family protein [Xanthobacter autotrophicus]|uniref:complex I subunit 5 family protein n=1 Tax=Xanthobacter TaxID=279 RepID=UPI0024AA0956|nr:complex I subunit 5 family protein [Xanthobacter autotrophicus]MDI4664931.1 complex I subunit 5 family protein [Xanthobacter autotrophicus]